MIQRSVAAMLAMVIFCQVNFSCKNLQTDSAGRIVVEADISKYFYWKLKDIFEMRKTIKLQYTSFQYLEPAPPISVAEEEIIGGKVRWTLHSDQPLYIYPPFGAAAIVNPGDSLHITYLAEEPVYSGNNESFALLSELMQANTKLIKPDKKHSYNVFTLEDFLQWNTYLDAKAAKLLPVIESYKGKISREQYNYYKTYTVGQIENERVDAFATFSDSAQRTNAGISRKDLNIIWDTTQYKRLATWLRSLPDYKAPIEDIYSFTRMEAWRRFSFDFSADSLNDKITRTYLYYTGAKNKYQGLTRERLMAYVLNEQTIVELGVRNSMTQTLLNDYYSLPGYPEYKQWVKNVEKTWEKVQYPHSSQ